MKTAESKSATTQAVQRKNNTVPFFQPEESREGFFGSTQSIKSFFQPARLPAESNPNLSKLIIQRRRTDIRARRKETIIHVRWSDDSVELYHNIVEATNRSATFSNVENACFWQPFNTPVHQFHRRHSGRHLTDLNEGDRIKIHVSGYYDGEDVPCLSQVNIWHEEDIPAPPPSSETPQPEAPTPSTPLVSPNLEEKGWITWNEETPERVYITGSGVTPRLIAEDFYGDGSKASHTRAYWNQEERGGPLTENTELPTNGFFVFIEYDHLRQAIKYRYNLSALVITRDIWGARPPITDDPNRSYEPYEGDLTSIYDSIAIHHSGNNGYRTMQEVQNFHMNNEDEPRADIGYHYGISMYGGIYEGRPINIKGSHIDQGNTGKIGIVLLADLDTGYVDDDDEITAQMESSLLRLIHSLIGRFPKIKYLGGHKEYNSARSCPGDLGMAKMSSWRSQTELLPPIPVN